MEILRDCGVFCIQIRQYSDKPAVYRVDAVAQRGVHIDERGKVAFAGQVIRGGAVEPVGHRLVFDPWMIGTNVVRNFVEHQLHASRVQSCAKGL